MDARSSRLERHPLSRQAQRRRGWYARLGTQSRRARWECWRSDAAWAAMARVGGGRMDGGGRVLVGGGGLWAVMRGGQDGMDGWTDALTRLTAAEAALTRLASARLGFICWRRCPPQRQARVARGWEAACHISTIFILFRHTRGGCSGHDDQGNCVFFKQIQLFHRQRALQLTRSPSRAGQLLLSSPLLSRQRCSPRPASTFLPHRDALHPLPPLAHAFCM